jgi:Ca2+-binding EF-hand superfamily protein
MDKYDKNNDAKIDIKEFANLVTAIDKKLPEDELKMMFEYLDSDKNGLISVSELKPILY